MLGVRRLGEAQPTFFAGTAKAGVVVKTLLPKKKSQLPKRF